MRTNIKSFRRNHYEFWLLNGPEIFRQFDVVADVLGYITLDDTEQRSQTLTNLFASTRATIRLLIEQSLQTTCPHERQWLEKRKQI
jgi:hypothetical protein